MSDPDEASPPGARPPPTASLLVTTCSSCGSQVSYAPGTTSLKCGACGRKQKIGTTGAVIHEHSYTSFESSTPPPASSIPAVTLRCHSCGAPTTTTALASSCPYCKGSLIALTSPPGLVTPEGVVPFAIDKPRASAEISKWVRSRRFAPTAFRKTSSAESITGVYLPHWTFDAHAESDYSGRRGDHYWETNTKTDRKGHVKTKRVKQTAWRPVSGQVSRDFDDLLVPAITNLTKAEKEAGPWPIERARPYQPEYLAGYDALRYDVDPSVGLEAARKQMEPVIDTDVRAGIGGDEQRVSAVNTRYSAIMFKLLLLPLWRATYSYGGKTFQVVINANTGEVQGKRPYSRAKIVALVAVVLLVIAAVVVALALGGGGASSHPGSPRETTAATAGTPATGQVLDLASGKWSTVTVYSPSGVTVVRGEGPEIANLPKS